MFSKSKINDPAKPPAPEVSQAAHSDPRPAMASAPAPSAPKPKAPASIISTDLHIVGNVKTSGDIQVEGTVDGDIRAHLLTVGENATVKGEIMADDAVIHGRVVGRVRGLKVRLTSSARVEGDIIHKTIAIESGAQFEGSVQRQDDPLSPGGRPAPKPQQQPHHAQPQQHAQPPQHAQPQHAPKPADHS